jgi:hypothetical protein
MQMIFHGQTSSFAKASEDRRFDHASHCDNSTLLGSGVFLLYIPRVTAYRPYPRLLLLKPCGLNRIFLFLKIPALALRAVVVDQMSSGFIFSGSMAIFSIAVVRMALSI